MLAHQEEALFERMRRYGLVGLWVSLLEEVCDLGKDLGFQNSNLSPGTHSLFLLPVDLEIEFSVTLRVPCLPACYCASHHDNELTSAM